MEKQSKSQSQSQSQSQPQPQEKRPRKTFPVSNTDWHRIRRCAINYNVNASESLRDGNYVALVLATFTAAVDSGDTRSLDALVTASMRSDG